MTLALEMFATAPGTQADDAGGHAALMWPGRSPHDAR